MTDEAATSRLEGYENRTAMAMVVLAFGYLALYSIEVLAWPIAEPAATILFVATTLIWVVFVADLIIRTFLSRRPIQYLVRHPIDVIACAVPAFRGLRVLRILTAGQWLIRRGSRLAVGKTAVALVIAVLFVSYVASLAVLDAERGAPDANITNFGDAVWWSFTTMSTVGYGDAFPVTFSGRAVAVGLMVVGVSLLGIVSATLASSFIARIRGEEESDTAKVLARLDGLEREMRLLREQGTRPPTG